MHVHGERNAAETNERDTKFFLSHELLIVLRHTHHLLRTIEPQLRDLVIVSDEIHDAPGHPLLADCNRIFGIGALKQARTQFGLRLARRIDASEPSSVDEFDLPE